MSSKPLSVQAVEEFIKLFQAVSTDPSFGHVHALVEENANLRVRNTSLNTAFNESVNRAAQLQGQVEAEVNRTAEKTLDLERATQNEADLKKRLGEAEAKLKKKDIELNATAEGTSQLQGTIKKMELEVSKLQESLKREALNITEAKKAENKVQGELEKTQRELNVNTTRLNELDNLMFKWKRSSQENTSVLSQSAVQIHANNEDSKQWLRAIFEPAYSLVQKHFGSDLESEVLADSSRWDKIRNHPSILRTIPIPSSNTPAAKNMRVAASLTILASALAEHVFRPTYLLKNDNELSSLLYDLALEDHKRERHLRSILMGVLPEDQKKNATKRAGDTVNDVVFCIGDMLANSKQQQFKSALEEVCRNICFEWMKVQQLAELVEPDFSFQSDERDNWKMLKLPQAEKSTPPQKARGGQPVSNNNATHLSENSSNLSTNDSVAVVWPAFVIYVKGDVNLLGPGFVLGKSQMETAQVEETSELSHGNRRAARQITRRNTIRNKVDKPNGKGFLSSGAGGSSGGD